jgi:hypothetical protein
MAVTAPVKASGRVYEAIVQEI